MARLLVTKRSLPLGDNDVPVGLSPVVNLLISFLVFRLITDKFELKVLTTYKNCPSSLSASPAGPLPVFKVYTTFADAKSITDTLSDQWLLT